MNDHTVFLSMAYALTAVCMIYEVVALGMRRHAALRRMRESIMEAEEEAE